MSIKNKLIVITVSLILIPTVVLTLLFYVATTRIVIQNEQRFIANTMNQAVQSLDGKLREIENVLYDISTDVQLQEHVKKIEKQEKSKYDYLMTVNEIKSIIVRKISKSNDIKAVYLRTNKGEEIKIKNVLENYPNNIPIQEVHEKKGGNVWKAVLKEYHVIPVYKELIDLKNLKDLGSITLYFDKQYLYQVLKKIQLSVEQELYLLDYNGKAIDELFPKELENFLNVDEKISDVQFLPVKIKQKKSQLILCGLKEVPWILAGIVKDGGQSQLLNVIRIATLLLFFVMSGLLTLMCIKLSNSITRPLVDLKEYMMAFSNGNFSVEVSVKYMDEIGILRKEFNKMVENTNHLIHKLFMEEKLKQQAQIKALQMQINPHFFYNTLDTIHWLAQMHHAKDISEVSEAFGKLMRFSLKDNGIISFEEELESVENYMKIQFYRYGENLKLDIRVQEEILYEFVPRHIMLPMIENAVEHGVANKLGEKKIIVRGIIQNSIIILDIFDNGQGMDEHTVEKLFQSKEMELDGKHMSIGIRNVHQRLKLMYGENAGVSIRSKIGIGTVVTISVPII